MAHTMHIIGLQESKFHIKTEMKQTIMEIFMIIQYVKHNHHAKNWKQKSSIDMSMKMNKYDIKLCDTHCHTIQSCIQNRDEKC